MPELRAPGVYVEELNNGPRPIDPSPTTETGFVAVLTLPEVFSVRKLAADSKSEFKTDLLIPDRDELSPTVSWGQALAFRPFLQLSSAAPDAESRATRSAKPADKAEKDSATPAAPEPAITANKLGRLIAEALEGGPWTVAPPDHQEDVLLLRSPQRSFRVPVRRSLLQVTKERPQDAEAWDLAPGGDPREILASLAPIAASAGVQPRLPLAEPSSRKTLDLGDIQRQFMRPASTVQSMDAYETWRKDIGKELFITIAEASGLCQSTDGENLWKNLGDHQSAWHDWLRRHPGMIRLEVSLRGFFDNGGRSAHVALALTNRAGVIDQRAFLSAAFDDVRTLALLAAPGLDRAWQEASLGYCRDRADSFAVLEAPRYLLTRPPQAAGSLEQGRWCKSTSPYEGPAMETLSSPDARELRDQSALSQESVLGAALPRDDRGFGAGYAPWVVVDNPHAVGHHDRYMLAPPAGHIAGMICGTDLRPGGGVQKAPANEPLFGVRGLATSVTEREQGALNGQAINVIRPIPGAGLRVWGARTVGTNANWRYVNVRRLFLMVERSIRESVQEFVFAPNTQQTRDDLRSTISAFLYRMWQEGRLDGKNHREAYMVRCDRDNNPDSNIEAGVLTVDVGVRPVFPAEFVLLRFAQLERQATVTVTEA